MKRRSFLVSSVSSLWMTSFAQKNNENISYDIRYQRPSNDSDEGGLWSYMDREEERLKKSPFLIRDRKFKEYLTNITCALGENHCPDIRVYPLTVPLFNANMAPNGMMQIWSGLMLRVDNEAQLSAILGHEIGHYLARHSIQRLRDSKSRSNLGFMTGFLGAAGALANLGLTAGGFSYSREHETSADEIGIKLMSKAGYDPNEAAMVWQNLQDEMKSSTEGEATGFQQLFSTHPLPKDRQENLKRIASISKGETKNEAVWQQKVSPYIRSWLKDEIKRNKFESSISLLNRLTLRELNKSEYLFARGEAFRLRSKGDDLEMALKDYKLATESGNPPPDTYKGLGLIYKTRNEKDLAKINFLKYQALEPNASDSMLIKSYLEEMES
jgi:predicted Zn-dependent protease